MSHCSLLRFARPREASAEGRKQGTRLGFIVRVRAECDMGIQLLGVDAYTRHTILMQEVRSMLVIEQPQRVNKTMGTQCAIEHMRRQRIDINTAPASSAQPAWCAFPCMVCLPLHCNSNRKFECKFLSHHEAKALKFA